MEIIKIAGLSLASIIILFTLTKIMGQREMSQLSIFAYSITITIGSIAAEMSTSLEDNFTQAVVAMIIYALVTLTVSFLNTKFVKLRPFLSGKTLILYDNGTLFKENAYFYQLNDNLDAYKYTGEFTICFWAKFKDLGKTDEAYGNKITLVLNDGTTISADIPANVVMTDYHWVKIQRDSSNLITISLDNSAIKTETSNAVFSLADNSYIFVGNTNRYFTGYEVIVDDILIFGGISSAVETTPNGYLNPARFTMLLYIKVSDGSVWGYKEV